MKLLIASLTATTVLAGCAAGSDPMAMFKGSSGSAAPAPALTLPEPPAEGGPAVATAVVNATYSIDGAILPVVRGQQRVDTRADMRRTDSLLTFDNWLLNKVAGDNQSADIVRLDRKLHYTLKPTKSTYTECPLTGCVTPGQKTPEEQQEKQEQAKKPSEPSCPVDIKSNNLTVSSTGDRKAINGFNTERYSVAWVMELGDQQGRRSTNRVTLDMWTAPEAGPIREVQTISENYQRRYATALSQGDTPFGKYVPREVLNSMSSLMRGMNPKDTKTLTTWANEMRKVRGYPISMVLAWTAEGNVCSDSAGSSAAAASGGISSLLGNLMGNAAQDKAKQSATSGALVTYNYEVKSIEVKPVADSFFVPPSTYTRAN